MSKNIYYVYLHRYASGPRMGEVFYVGKGKGVRAWKKGRNEIWGRIYKKYGYSVEIYKDFIDEVCAFTLEKIVIALYKSKGEATANLSYGGEGQVAFRQKTKDQ